MPENVAYNFFYQNILLVPAITFFIAAVLKWFYIKIKTWKIDVIESVWTWWMPSWHSAVVVSLAMAVALKYWVHNDLFAITLTFSMIIIYDAINIRFEAGQHAKEINKSLWEQKYKESLWHLPSEAFAWSLIWIAVAYILWLI